MIQINLLPIKEAKRRQQMFLVFYAGVSALMVLAVLGWFWWLQYQKVDELKQKIRKVEEESKGYEDKIREVKDLQAKEGALEGYRAAVISIYDDQKMVLSALDEIAVDVPSDIILDAIEQGRDKNEKTFTIKGMSMTEAAIQTFVDRLNRPGGPLSKATVETINLKVDKKYSANYSFTLKVEIGGAS
jgi:Tfp pilus assembly protein PilN